MGRLQRNDKLHRRMSRFSGLETLSKDFVKRESIGTGLGDLW